MTREVKLTIHRDEHSNHVYPYYDDYECNTCNNKESDLCKRCYEVVYADSVDGKINMTFGTQPNDFKHALDEILNYMIGE